MEATPSQKQRFWKRKGFIYTVAILFGVPIVLTLVGDSSNTNTPTTSPQPAVAQPSDKPTPSQKVSVGEEGYIKVTSPKTILANTRADYDDLIKTYLANDTAGLGDFLLAGKGVAVSNGTKVLVIDTAVGSRRVRVLEGDQIGKTGWISMEYVSKSKLQ